MNFASNVMSSAGGEFKVNTSIKIWFACLCLFLLVCTPLKGQAAEALKFRYALTLYTDDQGLAIKQPQGVACTGKSLVVADTGNNRLLRYTFTEDAGKPQAQVLKNQAMVYPQKIRLNRQGEILVLDGKLHRLLHLSTQGKFLGFIDPVGMSPGTQTAIRNFAVDPLGNLYYLDILAKRVLVCNSQGQFRRQIQFPESYGFFSDLAVDAKENIFLIDGINAQVFAAKSGATQFLPYGKKFKDYARFPTAIILDQQGRIYLADLNGSKIIVLGRDGSYVGRLSELGWKPGLLDHPSQICLDEQGDLFIADTSNNRVQKFIQMK